MKTESSSNSKCVKVKIKVKVDDSYNASNDASLKALRYSTHCQGIIQFYLQTLRFIHKLNEQYLPKYSNISL